MSRKWRERKKARDEGHELPPEKPKTAPEAVRQRRNKRFLFVALIGISFPILELIAYQYRGITISLVNRSDQAIRKIKVIYPGGEFEADELKPGGSIARLVRPNFTFKGNDFSTYSLSIRFATEGGGFFRQLGRAGALDYSAQEIYTVTQIPPENRLQLEHTTRPGFPLSLVRDLMRRMGFG